MQIKKDKIKSKLLQSAKGEFLKKGFEKASIRSIVKNADTTIGNFYNYFGGKEEIFSALVDKTHKSITLFIQNHKAEDEDPFVLDSLNSKLARALVSQALGLLTESFIENLILLAECSQGTWYADTKRDITLFIHRHFAEHAQLINPDYKDNGIGLLLSDQFVAGTLSVLKQDVPAQLKAEIITEYLIFYVNGMISILDKAGENRKASKRSPE